MPYEEYEAGAHGMQEEYEEGSWDWNVRKLCTPNHVSVAKVLMRSDAIRRLRLKRAAPRPGRSHLTTNPRGAPAENCGQV